MTDFFILTIPITFGMGYFSCLITRAFYRFLLRSYTKDPSLFLSPLLFIVLFGTAIVIAMVINNS